MGGGVMRAAAKVVGLGIVNNGLRGGVQVNPSSAEYSVMRVAASRSASSGISLSGGGVSSVSDMTTSANQKVSWETVDDWEFAGVVEEKEGNAIPGGGKPMARVLFGGVPTLEEAKEATTDLKDALDKVYLSSPNLTDNTQSSSLLTFSNAEETKDCVAYDVKDTSVPKPAIQAFKLLNESPAVQSVVASIATDPNVWNAVLNNPAYMDFIRSYKTSSENFAYCFICCFRYSMLLLLISSILKHECVADNEFEDNGSSPRISESCKTSSENFAYCFICCFRYSMLLLLISSILKHECVADYEFEDNGSSPRISESSVKIEEYFDGNQPKDGGNPFSGFLQNVKTTVVEMVNKATDFIQSLFASPSAEDAKEKGGSNYFEKTIGASVMGLAVMVIMVVLLKRV